MFFVTMQNLVVIGSEISTVCSGGFRDGRNGRPPPLGRIRKFFNIDYASIMMQVLIFSPPFSIPSLILINL